MFAFFTNLWRNFVSLFKKGMLIKVARLGKKTEEFYLPHGATISTLLKAGNYTNVTEEIRVNNQVVDREFALANGDVVTMVPEVNGG